MLSTLAGAALERRALSGRTLLRVVRRVARAQIEEGLPLGLAGVLIKQPGLQLLEPGGVVQHTHCACACMNRWVHTAPRRVVAASSPASSSTPLPSLEVLSLEPSEADGEGASSEGEPGSDGVYASSSSSSSSSSKMPGMWTGASGAAGRCRDWDGPVPRFERSGTGRLRLVPAPPRSRRASAMGPR